jgi:hypothetical protein
MSIGRDHQSRCSWRRKPSPEGALYPCEREAHHAAQVGTGVISVLDHGLLAPVAQRANRGRLENRLVTNAETEASLKPS